MCKADPTNYFELLQMFLNSYLEIGLEAMTFSLAHFVEIDRLRFLWTLDFHFSVCGEKWESVLLAYYALFLPCGHNNRQALKGGKLPFLSG